MGLQQRQSQGELSLTGHFILNRMPIAETKVPALTFTHYNAFAIQ